MVTEGAQQRLDAEDRTRAAAAGLIVAVLRDADERIGRLTR